MAINKVPNNYYNDTNIRRDKINMIIDHVNELDTHAVVPTPAAGDVGKVVKVGSDGYELASDAGAKLVTATVTTDGQGNHSCDKTYAELSTSIANGDIVELSYLYQTFVFSGIDFSGIHFVLATNDSNGHNVITAWTISSANVITFNIEGINTELPAYSSADEGKVLTVDTRGALEFANVSGGPTIIDLTWNGSAFELPNDLTCGKLANMVESGANVFLKVNRKDSYYFGLYTLALNKSSQGSQEYMWSKVSIDTNNTTATMYWLYFYLNDNTKDNTTVSYNSKVI